MDDHMYNRIMSYAECELIPRFQLEYKDKGTLAECNSYPQIKDLCIALNAVGKWAGYGKVTPSSLLDR